MVRRVSRRRRSGRRCVGCVGGERGTGQWDGDGDGADHVVAQKWSMSLRGVGGGGKRLEDEHVGGCSDANADRRQTRIVDCCQQCIDCSAVVHPPLIVLSFLQ